MAAGGAAQPDAPDGLGRRLQLLLMRGLLLLQLLRRLTSNARRRVALGEVARVGGL